MKPQRDTGVPFALDEYREARDCLVRAAAALTEPYAGENLGAAVLWTAMGLLHIAKGDEAVDGRGQAAALKMLQRLRQPAEQP